MIKLDDFTYVLDTVEKRIASPPRQINPLSFNKWLLASGMQKAIRRGEVEQAIQLAANLLHQDKRMFWRRIEVTALEDIGIGGSVSITETLAIALSPRWRKRIGSLKAALHCVRVMSESVKSRSTTHGYFLAEISPLCQEARNRLSRLDEDGLIDTVLDRQQTLGERILALWLIAGTDRYPSKHLMVRKGNLDLAAKIMNKMSCPVPVLQMCVLSLKRARHPLALLTPLLFDVYGHLEHKIVSSPLSKTKRMRGLPLYAMDALHTRDGKACIREWRKQSTKLQGYTSHQIATAVFHVEGCALDQELLNKRLSGLKRTSTTANFWHAKLNKQKQVKLTAIVQEDLGKLNAIREQLYGETI